MVHFAPTLICLLVFFAHLTLVVDGDFSIHGGGLFGMFSTLDSAATRHVKAKISIDGETKLLNLSEPQLKLNLEAVTAYPSRTRLVTFANFLLCQHEGGQSLELQYLKEDFLSDGRSYVLVDKVAVERDCPTAV